MIAQLAGIIAEKAPTRIILDVKGVGYELHVPVSTFEKLADIGKHAKLFTHLHVREDNMQLFGFATQKEKEMFSNLISVSGIGPKLALGILSGSAVPDLIRNIVNEELEILTRLSGVGKKTAQRLTMELKDKLKDTDFQSDVSLPLVENTAQAKLEEAVLALVSLGYNRTNAQKILVPIIKNDPSLPLDELIKRTLQSI